MAFSVASKPTACFAAGQRRPTRVSRARTVSPRAALELKPLPYATDAFEPLLSKESFDFHYGKHHRAYVDNLNKQIAGTEWETKTLEEIVVGSWANGTPTPAFNNAAQIWNHTFFWEGMTPTNGGGAPTGTLAEAITRDFGSFDNFKNEFKTAGMTQFGSGWAWLVSDSTGKLSISKTPNAVLPVVEGKTALLTCDVWEHAYYIDYRNRRPDFIQTFLDKLVDWNVVASRYSAVKA
ncbi:hypothetical protein CEUSTIGMA_g8133.t1 [Chlamydomonas eustigma]|uniref:Superoxide dismutase n=1 Tax=Chlamydomonas eustigma TaxID=1157962 RepID=A0A250XC94_9CHLO|nr:hypothetical protein CEUSTIGMA_g8133.t1 [Chlamydomonas eustigma]|eukprot:GAX80698.1 hypothetical protein CEUSTIGMA_g8133.t1 [Chlamydomonas eustigma]